MAATTAGTLKLGEALDLIWKLHPCNEEFAVYQEMDRSLPAYSVWATAHPTDRLWVINALRPALRLPCEDTYLIASRKATHARHAAWDAARATLNAAIEAMPATWTEIQRFEAQQVYDRDFDRAVAASWEDFNALVALIERDRDRCQASRASYHAVVRALLAY